MNTFVICSLKASENMFFDRLLNIIVTHNILYTCSKLDTKIALDFALPYFNKMNNLEWIVLDQTVCPHWPNPYTLSD
jgi:hypothetical protein